MELMEIFDQFSYKNIFLKFSNNNIIIIYTFVVSCMEFNLVLISIKIDILSMLLYWWNFSSIKFHSATNGWNGSEYVCNKGRYLFLLQ